MNYLHTMIRIGNIDDTLEFFALLGFKELSRYDSEEGRYTNIFIAAADDMAEAKEKKAPLLELTYNWDEHSYGEGRNFGHLAYRVDDIYKTCQKLMDAGVTINRPPRDGYMAFVRTPDNISIELLQKGDALPVKEPWASMENIGSW